MRGVYLFQSTEFDFNVMKIDPDDIHANCQLLPVDIANDDFDDLVDREFLLAAAVIKGGEKWQRRTINRKRLRGTRNICNEVKPAVVYLGWTLIPGAMIAKRGRLGRKMMKKFTAFLHDAILEAREALGWPDEPPTLHSYEVSDRVLAAAASTGCEAYFAPLAGQRLFMDDLEKINSTLQKSLPDTYKTVIRAILSTESREHLSLISFCADDQGKIYIEIVDKEGHRLKTDASGFSEVLAHPETPRRLHVFPKKTQREQVAFAFNNHAEGTIVAKYLPERSILDVVLCRGEGRYANVIDRSLFYLDQEYLACLWVVLQRLSEDRGRYEALKAKADATIEFDPFQNGLIDSPNKGV